MILRPPDLHNSSILIVDDQEANVQLLEQLLDGAGYTNLTTTMNPVEVCALHSEHHYDLILLDLQMPVMDGFQVMESLKANSDDSYLPVIVLTAQPAHKIKALQTGAKDFISKPFDVLEVKTRIHNMLEVRRLYKELNSCNKLLGDDVRARTAELHANEARFRQLNKLASDWYWEQDAEGNFINTAAPILDMLGITSPRANLNKLSPSSNYSVSQNAPLENGYLLNGWRQQDLALLQEKIANRQPFLDFAFSRVSNNGQVRHCRLSGEPIFDHANRFTGYRGIGIECKTSATSS